jgi:hypothetical protein
VRDGLIPNLFLEGQNQDLYLEGTRFGIKVDPRDGLLSQGAEVTRSPGWMQKSATGS